MVGRPDLNYGCSQAQRLVYTLIGLLPFVFWLNIRRPHTHGNVGVYLGTYLYDVSIHSFSFVPLNTFSCILVVTVFCISGVRFTNFPYQNRGTLLTIL